MLKKLSIHGEGANGRLREEGGAQRNNKAPEGACRLTAILWVIPCSKISIL